MKISNFNYTRKKVQVVTDLQTSCNKVVVCEAIIRMCSHCLFPRCCDKWWNKLSSLCSRLMATTDLLQVVPGNTGCLKQVVTRLLSSTF